MGQRPRTSLFNCARKETHWGGAPPGTVQLKDESFRALYVMLLCLGTCSSVALDA